MGHSALYVIIGSFFSVALVDNYMPHISSKVLASCLLVSSLIHFIPCLIYTLPFSFSARPFSPLRSAHRERRACVRVCSCLAVEAVSDLRLPVALLVSVG